MFERFTYKTLERLVEKGFKVDAVIKDGVKLRKCQVVVYLENDYWALYYKGKYYASYNKHLQAWDTLFLYLEELEHLPL